MAAKKRAIKGKPQKKTRPKVSKSKSVKNKKTSKKKSPVPGKPVSKKSSSKRSVVKKNSRPNTRKKHTAGVQKSDPSSSAFPIVGIGASAGGLEAYTGFFRHLPADSGMGFVLVQHQDPKHKSLLADILAREAQIPVTQVKNGMVVQPNHAYVIPPNKDMIISKGVLKLKKQVLTKGRHLPIDLFFRSLAEDQKNLAVGVILSGTASDGVLGLMDIRGNGGITFAQDEASAKFKDMPINAVATGSVNFVMPPGKIAKELSQMSKRPVMIPIQKEDDEVFPPKQESSYQKILFRVLKATGADFANYKRPTISRRIQRRMALHKLTNLDDYLAFLQSNSQEVYELFQDMVINVTSFFREPESFELLKSRVFPKIIDMKEEDQPVRIWVPGCSTGEEVYSIAMSLIEFMDGITVRPPIQIFGTDLNESVIEKARSGTYLKNIEIDVSPERLRRFFTKSENGYQMNKSVREMVIFSQQDLTRDPPFSKLDLISCRNVLIYFGNILQKKVFPVFHYAINPGGYLLLGNSESVGEFSNLFHPVGKKVKLFNKVGTVIRGAVEFLATDPVAEPPRKKAGVNLEPIENKLVREANQIVLNKYSPSHLIINPSGDIIHMSGDLERYLRFPEGRPSANLFKIVREQLLFDLRSLVNASKKSGKPSKKTNIYLKTKEEIQETSIEVLPMKAGEFDDKCFMVIFEEIVPLRLLDKDKDISQKRSRGKDEKAERDDQIVALEKELVSTHSYLKSIVEDYEVTNEELKAANEEIQSRNEELQSLNEELETGKEELQSSNEELSTVNDELKTRNQELDRVHNDLLNIFTSTRIPMVILSEDLRLRTFTPAAEKLFRIVPGDRGRPVKEIRFPFQIPDLEGRINEVLDIMRPMEQEIQDGVGNWYLMRIQPYLTADKKIEGAVLSFVDINETILSKEHSETLIETVQDPIVVLDQNFSVVQATPAFYEIFQVSPGGVEKKEFFSLGKGHWDKKGLRSGLEKAFTRGVPVHNFEVSGKFHRIGNKTFLLNARRIQFPNQNHSQLLLSIKNISSIKEAEIELHKSKILFETLATNAPVGVWRSDVNGKFVYMNDRCAELIGLKVNEALGRNWGKNLHPEDKKRVNAAWRETCKEQIPFHLEYRFTLPKGKVSWVLGEAFPVFNEAGEIDGFVGTITDITRQKLQEQERIQQQSHLEELVEELRTRENDMNRAQEMSDFGNWVWDLTTNHLSWSPSIYRIFGLKPQEFGGTYEDFLKSVHPDDLEFVTTSIDKSLKKGYSYDIEHRIVKPDGSVGVVHERSDIIRDKSGKPLKMLGTVLDVTYRKNIENELKYQNEKLESLVNEKTKELRESSEQLEDERSRLDGIIKSIFDGLVVVNEEGTILLANEAVGKTLGYRHEELAGKNVTLMMPEPYNKEHPEYVRKYLKTGSQNIIGMTHELEARHKKGHLIPIELSVTEIFSGDDKCYIGTLRDISEKKIDEQRLIDAKEEAEKANLTKSAFLNRMSHELRTPLNAILGFAQLLLKGQLEPARREYVENIFKGGKHLLELINEILDLSRIEAGEVKLAMANMNMTVEVKNILDNMQPLADDEGIRFVNEVLNQDCWIWADSLRVKQVLYNLIDNAIRYNKPEGTVTVSAHKASPDKVRIVVEDTGTGIKEDRLKDIFEPFVRLEMKNKFAYGTGIGLSVVERLVSLMNGTVHVESRVNEGSRFILEFPEGKAEGEPGVSEPFFPVIDASLQNMKFDGQTILYVEDNLANLSLVRKIILSIPGLKFQEAQSGEEGLEVARRIKPDLILMDIGLPGIDGIETVRRMKSHPTTQNIPAVAVSAHAIPSEVQLAQESGFDDYITKPFEVNRLIKALIKFLA